MDYLNNKVVVVLVVKTLDGLKDKISNLIAKGYEVLEVTLRTECAFDAISLIKKEFPNLKVGAGTVLTIEQVERCVEVKADFGVSPGLNPKIVKAAQAIGFAFIPGVATPSDVELAIEMDIELVKLFPAKILGGVDFVKALSGPYHMMKFMPTGGITEDTSHDYLSVPSVVCVGGTWMS